MNKMYMINEVSHDMLYDCIQPYGFTNRADVEEYILSLVEETAYRDFIHWILYAPGTPEEYFEMMKRLNNGYYKTIECFIDNYCEPDYEIIEGKLF